MCIAAFIRQGPSRGSPPRRDPAGPGRAGRVILVGVSMVRLALWPVRPVAGLCASTTTFGGPSEAPSRASRRRSPVARPAVEASIRRISASGSGVSAVSRSAATAATASGAISPSPAACSAMATLSAASTRLLLAAVTEAARRSISEMRAAS